jgi:hypothetical protein
LRRFDRRTAALGVVAAGAVAAATLVTVEGHSSTESPAHRSVSTYIKQVDGVQQQLRVRLTKMFTAYREFATQTKGATVARDVRAAERTLAAVERRVRALHPPPEAARLHRLVLELLEADRGVAHELSELTTFTPRLHAAVTAAAVAGKRLSRALAAARLPAAHAVRGTPKQIARARAIYRTRALAAASAQADAVVSYCRRLGAILALLHGLHPPRVMAPTLDAQIAALKATRRTGFALGDELRKTDLSNVPVLSRRFSVAARTAASVAAQRAQIAAIKAYNARVRRTGALNARIRGEVVRLQTALG